MPTNNKKVIKNIHKREFSFRRVKITKDTKEKGERGNRKQTNTILNISSIINHNNSLFSI